MTISGGAGGGAAMTIFGWAEGGGAGGLAGSARGATGGKEAGCHGSERGAGKECKTGRASGGLLGGAAAAGANGSRSGNTIGGSAEDGVFAATAGSAPGVGVGSAAGPTGTDNARITGVCGRVAGNVGVATSEASCWSASNPAAE